MKRREPLRLPRHDYPVDDWRLIEQRFSRQLLPRTETLFTVSNGYLGLRGNHEEGRPAHDHGTLVNGFHESWPIIHAEEAYGLAKTGQTIVDVPDSKIIKLYVDDEPLYLPTAYLHDYERVLDMRTGVLQRTLVWETPSGKAVQVRSTRLVSMRHRHLAAYSYEVCVLNSSAPIVISSQLLNRQDLDAPDEMPGSFDPRATRRFEHQVLEPRGRRSDGQRCILCYRAANSKMTLACGVDHHFTTDNDYDMTSECNDDLGKVVFIVEAQREVPIKLVKFASYHTSRGVPAPELADRADRVLRRAASVGFDGLVKEQRRWFDAAWKRSDVQIEGDPEAQQALRWNLFQLLQAAGRAEGTGIPAKGLTGHGYEGHYFWDIEIFVLPFLCYSDPRIARNLLRFRASMLKNARERAAEMNQRGALFPWRTINGEEASAYYQAGTAQYHLNADIAYSIKRYVDVTGDRLYLAEYGAEILVETARLWVDLGHYDDHDRFHLHAVTGPDEYTTVVDDNAYTNLMARLNLHFAAQVVAELAAEDTQHYRTLCADVDLDPSELDDWRRAADAMHIPFDERRGVNPQDEHFLTRKKWDFENTPPDKYPLLLHYHPLVIYRHQVIKQADVVLAMFLLGNEFSLERKRKNFAYYDPLTTADSSLSPPAHAILAAEIGDRDKAMGHFRTALEMDLADVAHNVDHGAHIASTGGTWMTVVYGFGGMRDFDGKLSFDPFLPDGWTRLCFPLRVADNNLHVDIRLGSVTFRLEEGDGMTVHVRGKPFEIDGQDAVTVELEEKS